MISTKKSAPRSLSSMQESSQPINTPSDERLEQKLADCIAKQQQTEENFEALHYAVSHDFTAPLRAIIGFSQLLVERYEFLKLLWK